MSSTQIYGLFALLLPSAGKAWRKPRLQSCSSSQPSSTPQLYGKSTKPVTSSFVAISASGLADETRLLFRQNGIGYTSFVARLGVSIAPLIILLDDVWRLLPQVIYGAVAVVAGLVASKLPETQNTRMPEFIEDVEEPRSAQPAKTAMRHCRIFYFSHFVFWNKIFFILHIIILLYFFILLYFLF